VEWRRKMRKMKKKCYQNEREEGKKKREGEHSGTRVYLFWIGFASTREKEIKEKKGKPEMTENGN
jgi:hypothetical protein